MAAPTRNAATVVLLRYTILALIAGPIGVLILLGPQVMQATINFVGPLVMLTIGLMAWYLLKRGRIGLVSMVLAIGVCANVTAIAAFTGGIRSPTTVVYPVIILMTGWLVSAWAAIAMAGLITFLCFGLWWGEGIGLLATVAVPQTSIYLLHLVIIFALSAVLVLIVLDAYNQRLQQQTRAESALTASEARYRTLIEWTPEPILVHSYGSIVYVNPAAVRLFGAPDAATLMRRNTTELVHPSARAEQTARMNSIYRGERIEPVASSKFLRFDGSAIDVEVQGTAIDFDGKPCIHVLIRDISARKQTEELVHQLAYYDSLTSLANRLLLRDRLTQSMLAGKRSGRYGAMLFMDLDNFKPVNDRYGHGVGDTLLIEVSRRLESVVRETDTVARFGGDEFVVLLHDLSHDQAQARSQAGLLAEKCRRLLAQPYSLHVSATTAAPNSTGHVEHHCAASIGVALFLGTAQSEDEVIKRADLAMYQAKFEGRNCICFDDSCQPQAGADSPR